MAAWLLTVGCDPPDPVPAVEMGPGDAEQGQLSATIEGQDYAWTSDATGVQSLSCTAFFPEQHACLPSKDFSGDLLGEIRIACEVSDPADAIVKLDAYLYLGDFRQWTAGAHSVSAEGNSWFSRRCPPADPHCGLADCWLRVEGVQVALDVTEAVGSDLPWPDLVTADFRRRFSLSFDFSSQGDPAFENCSHAQQFSGSMVVSLDASHFHGVSEYFECE